MNLNRQLILLLAILFSCAYSFAGPVRTQEATFTQPDGSTFPARIKGDEWTKIRTTADGCAITRDKDGWWCYATYDQECKIQNTGYKVGRDVPESIKSSSRQIPHSQLRQRALSKRSIVKHANDRRLEATRRMAIQAKASGSTTEVRGLAILVQFEDVKFKYKREDFVNLLNQSGYNGTGSAKDYFMDQFGPGWKFNFDVSDIVTLNKSVAYYGENNADGEDIRAAELIRDACKAVDAQIDFSQYDIDEDGEVDNVYVFYAGEDESANISQTDLLWAHQWYIYSGGGLVLTCDSKKIDRYACSSELESRTSMTEIGTYCHEFSHTFGLVDLYDVDYEENGQTAGVWRSTSLMDGGNYNNNSKTPPYYNCIERELLGLSSPTILKEGDAVTLEPIHRNGAYCRLETDTEGEYYLIECRSEDGWDKHIGGSGLLIYHVDKNATERVGRYTVNKWEYNTVNNSSSHMCADVIEADKRPDYFATDEDYKKARKYIRGIFYPQDNVTAMTPESHPSYKFWNGNKPSLSITGIKKVGESVSFNVTDVSKQAETASVENVSILRFPDAAIIQFQASEDYTGMKAVLEWKRHEETEYTNSVIVEKSEDGTYVYKIDCLESGNAQYDLTIHFENKSSIGNIYRQSILTKRKPAIDWPYIYFSDLTDSPDNRFNVGETIPLHIVNATEADSVEWSFNGTTLTEDTLLKITEGGELRAKVNWKNGSCDTIIKHIAVIEQ